MQSSSKKLITATLAGIVAILAGGAIHGRLTQRWEATDELVRAAEVVESFPKNFGPWRLEESLPLGKTVRDMLQCAGEVNRVYVNSETSEQIQMFVIVGPPGPTAVHTPEICYSSRDYDTIEQRKRVSLEQDKEENSFWSLKLSSKRPGGADRLVYYAWTNNKSWDASEAPRYEYGGMPYLYKIQVTGIPLLTSDPDDDDLCQRFLSDLLKSGWRPEAIKT